jgi:hypothetical protein
VKPALFLFLALFAGCTGTTNKPIEVVRTDAPVDSSSARLAAPRGVVEVLNGTGRRGVANLVAERLRRDGFDVVKIGNAAEQTYARTIVAQRREAPAISALVAASLGVDQPSLFHNENLLVDATVFVGRDIEEILPQ